MKTLKHPYAHTLSLFRLALEQLPPTFPKDRRKAYMKQLSAFEKETSADYQAITEAIVAFGKESWPWRMAYQELYDTYGRASEEAHLLGRLDDGLRQKYEKFIHDGGKLNHLDAPRTKGELYQPSSFERYFTPEEKFAISRALVDARDEARQEIDSLATEAKAQDYSKAIESWLQRQGKIEKKIDELRQLASVSEKWRPELINRIRLIEEGWSVVEPGVDESVLDRELEYWKGTLESFLHQ